MNNYYLDFRGTELQEGDLVVHFGSGRYSYPGMYQVVGKTPQKVRLQSVNKETGLPQSEHATAMNADHCLKVGEKGIFFAR